MMTAGMFFPKLVAVLLLHGLSLGAPGRPVRLVTERLAAFWRQVASHQALAVVLTFGLALGASALFCLPGPLPEPTIHDEFSYLLAADTFRQGRLTNPTHPFWPHFESMHIIQQPSTMSKYPPGQGLVLALGWVLWGHPIAGVWLGLALACAAICWMLQAWLPPGWALLGGALAALILAPGPWGQTYWGGGVAALGGALVFGALRRILHRPRWYHGLLLAAGFVILANTRPYEGLAASLPVMALLLVWACRHRNLAAQVALPAVAVLGLSGMWMAWYNVRVTGHALQTPYQVHDAAYAAAPLFLWQQEKQTLPEYRHPVMRDYYVDYEWSRFERRRTHFGWNGLAAYKLWNFFKFFIGPLFAFTVVGLRRCLSDGWTRFALLTCGLLLLASTQTLHFFPHYAAPIAGLVVLLLVQGLRSAWKWECWARPSGRFLVAGVVTLQAFFCFLPVVERLQEPACQPGPRTQIATALEHMGGKHLVFVHYGADHVCHDEWVYNGADIDRSSVVWAREIGPTEDGALRNYFGDRYAWRVFVNEAKKLPRIEPYYPDSDAPYHDSAVRLDDRGRDVAHSANAAMAAR